MMRKTTAIYFCIVLLATACIAGCTSQTATPASGTAAPTTIQALPPATAVPDTTVPATIPTQSIPSATKTVVQETKVILNEKDLLTTKTYKTFDFKKMGIEFLHPGEKYKVSVKSEKPVLAYAVNTEQAGQLQALVPHYESYSNKIQWGLVNPTMVLGKVTDDTKEFTVEDITRATYVIDGRWMSLDNIYSSSTEPFSFEITITKTYSPPTKIILNS